MSSVQPPVRPARVAIVGGGVAGLAAAYRLAASGHDVRVYERESVFGGLASSFPIDDGHLERFYHFICLKDTLYFDTLRELGLSSRLRWRLTRMGQYYQGRLYSFGYPWDILRFSPLPLGDRLRFARAILAIKSEAPDGWKRIEDETAEAWTVRHFGQRMYDILYRPLLEMKFHERARTLSAAWLWARIHRLGKSRTRLLQLEKLGYIEGGSQVLVDALADRVRSAGGELVASAGVDRIEIESGAVRAVVTRAGRFECDAVITTVPTPYLSDMLPGAPAEYRARLREIDSIGVSCLLLRLTRPFTPFFWTNISDPRIPLAGLIEYSNLNPGTTRNGDRFLYIPDYLPSDSPRFRRSNDEVLRECLGHLKLIRPEFDPSWVRQSWVFRATYAQPLCGTGFTRQVIDIAGPVQGLFITDSHQLHPDDRTISNSLGLGFDAAARVRAFLESRPA